MRDFEVFRLDDTCMKCRLQRSNAIRRPRNYKILNNHADTNKMFNVYINILPEQEEKQNLLENEEKPENT